MMSFQRRRWPSRSMSRTHIYPLPFVKFSRKNLVDFHQGVIPVTAPRPSPFPSVVTALDRLLSLARNIYSDSGQPNLCSKLNIHREFIVYASPNSVQIFNENESRPELQSWRFFPVRM